MKDLIHLHRKRLLDVVPHQLEPRLVKQVRHVAT
jgi:hypothetical protein